VHAHKTICAFDKDLCEVVCGKSLGILGILGYGAYMRGTCTLWMVAILTSLVQQSPLPRLHYATTEALRMKIIEHIKINVWVKVPRSIGIIQLMVHSGVFEAQH
jgi:hypothetical protein